MKATAKHQKHYHDIFVEKQISVYLGTCLTGQGRLTPSVQVLLYHVAENSTLTLFLAFIIGCLLYVILV